MLCYTGQNRFECKQCGTKFSLRGQLNQHKKNHKGEKRFECSYCYKRFSHKGHLNEHKRIHTGEKPFKCHECEKCFNRKGLLKQHQRLTHQLSHYLNIQMDEEALSENQHDECFTSTENLQKNKFTGERGKSRGANDMFEPQRVVVEMERECRNITETSRKLNLLYYFQPFWYFPHHQWRSGPYHCPSSWGHNHKPMHLWTQVNGDISSQDTNREHETRNRMSISFFSTPHHQLTPTAPLPPQKGGDYLVLL